MKYTVEAEATVNAPASRVYALLADYQHGHPRVLPSTFTGLQVIEGGTGAGTIIDVGMKAFGKVRMVRGYVTEPEPGRVLEEAYPESNIVTRFYVAPVAERSSRVRIWSELSSKSGMIGWLERKLVTSFLRKVYRQELQLIESVANDQTQVL
ncbi:MAG TPA: SRPBCC family protein [Longimicrobiales bacterium]